MPSKSISLSIWTRVDFQREWRINHFDNNCLQSLKVYVTSFSVLLGLSPMGGQKYITTHLKFTGTICDYKESKHVNIYHCVPLDRTGQKVSDMNDEGLREEGSRTQAKTQTLFNYAWSSIQCEPDDPAAGHRFTWYLCKPSRDGWL